MTEQIFSYLDILEEQNNCLAGMKRLYLYPGMEFRSEIKWWADTGQRATPHEGVDICYFIDSNGQECRVTSELRVPVMARGRVLTIIKDYLGETVFLDHQYEQLSRFVSIYAHITPLPDLKNGDTVYAGDVIGTVTDTKGKKNRIPAHLHISLMTIAKEVPAEKFDWDMLSYPEDAKLIDPLTMIDTKKVECIPRNHWKEMFGL
ncbi:peptidoglycan DD-metalloendopeptidase family protein [Desulforhopalus sp. 52FAK]